MSYRGITPRFLMKVATLFRGHTDLFEGFNMLLPVGYKIEVQSINVVKMNMLGRKARTMNVMCNSASVGGWRSAEQSIILPDPSNVGIYFVQYWTIEKHSES